MTSAHRAPLVASLFASLVVATAARSARAEDQAPPAPTATVDTRLVVSVPSERHVMLEREDANGEWKAVCSSPCTARLAAGTRVRIGGEAFVESAPHVLEGQPGERIQMNVEPALREDRVARSALGGILIGVGGVSLGLGALAYAMSGLAYLNLSCDPSAPAGTCQTDAAHKDAARQEQKAKTTGIGMAIGGGVLAGAGVALLVNGQSLSTIATLAGAPPPKQKEAARWSLGVTPVRHGSGAAFSVRF
jgi:hypothetical protein